MAFTAKTRIDHNGTVYEAGDTIPLTEAKDYAPLLECGAIEGGAEAGEKPLSALTVAQLTEIATTEGVEIAQGAKKADIVAAIEAARTAAPVVHVQV